MSLADKIIEQNESGDQSAPRQTKPEFFRNSLPEIDELGLPTANCIEYLIARIIYVDTFLSGPDHLHLRDGNNFIWEGSEPIGENKQNLYRLLKWQGRPLTADQQAMVWARLRDYLPTLNESKLIVKDNLVYDREKGEMYFSDNNPNKVN